MQVLGPMVAQQLLVRTPEAACLLNVDAGLTTEASPACAEEAVNSTIWASDGSNVAVINGQGIYVADGNSLASTAHLPAPQTNAAAFSGSSQLLLTHQRPSREQGNPGRNLTLWRWREAQPLLRLTHKGYTKDDWPALQLSHSETEAFHAVTNTVNCYRLDSSGSTTAIRRLQLKGLGGFAISPGSAPLIAAYVAEAKGSPGFVGIWDHAALPPGGEPPPPIARRSFFRANQVKLMWAATGQALLALTSSDSDPTNRSYYGDAKLHFLSADGRNDVLVQLKEGPVHDASWAPDGKIFAVVAGFIPSRTLVFDAACRQIANLGDGAYNLLRWSPHSRFIAVAGFGNLPGDVAFHERTDKGSFQQLGSTRAEYGVQAEWAPDGRLLLIATTAPRLRVDNGITLYAYHGALLAKQPYQVLLDASWRPAKIGTYPDRPSSPGRTAGAAGGATANGKGAATGPAAKPAQGYVPPQLRDQAGGSASGSTISLSGPPKAAFRSSDRLPPGAEPAEKTVSSVSKNARRRANKAKGKEGPGAEDAQNQNGTSQPAAEATSSTAATTSSLAGQQASQQSAAAEDRDPGKRAKALQKKLRQIQQLKDKAEQGALEPEQMQKLAGEQAVLAELQTLGIDG